MAWSLAYEMNGIPKMQCKQWSVQDFGVRTFSAHARPCDFAQCSRKEHSEFPARVSSPFAGGLRDAAISAVFRCASCARARGAVGASSTLNFLCGAVVQGWSHVIQAGDATGKADFSGHGLRRRFQNNRFRMSLRSKKKSALLAQCSTQLRK